MKSDLNVTQILVIGGGYGGMMAAIRLAGKLKRQSSVQVTLVNASDQFVQRPLLHETAANIAVKGRPIVEMLKGTQAQFIQGIVTQINPNEQTVMLADGQNLPYHYLIYALGSSIERDSTPGVREYAYVLNPSGERSALALREKLQMLAQHGGKVAVVGGGATGVEAATEIKDAYPHLDVSMVTQGEVGAFKNPRVQKYIEKALARMKIPVYSHTRVTEVRSDKLVTSQGEIACDVCLWSGGFIALPLARESGLQVNDRGQILVDAYLRSLSHPNIYAIGDSAQPVHKTGAPMRMSIFPALVMGAHTADNLTRTLSGKSQKSFGFSYYGQGIALGRRDAIGFLTYPDDDPVGPWVTGRAGVQFRRFFVNLVLYFLELERRMPGSFFWNGKNRGEAASETIYVIPSARPSSHQG